MQHHCGPRVKPRRDWAQVVRGLLALMVSSLSGLASQAQALPETVTAALARAQVPLDAVSLLLADADGKSAPRLSYRAQAVMNPASVMKLVTTYAALDLLGPAYTWRTPVWLDGPVTNGVLKGNLVIQGLGDPKLVQERLWLLLQRVQGLGVRKIDGDIVLDHSAFAPIESNPADFDGEPSRPYNVAPDALLFNFKSVSLTFVPDATASVAHVIADARLQGVQVPAAVPLAADKTLACGDYRSLLEANLTDPARISFSGSYPASCGEKVWSVAYADPASYNARNIEALWHSMGGQLSGSARNGRAPGSPASLQLVSPPLAEVIRDINKNSNNLMARQLFLTLALPQPNAPDAAAPLPGTPVTPGMAREVVLRWWQQRISATEPLLLDNGAGLSRLERVTAQGLLALLQVAYASATMPELMASLPIVGVDGTLKRSQAPLASAHLKTGSLRDVVALAGYVHAAGGRQLCLVAIVNHANAAAARPALEALLTWAVGDNAAH